MRIGQCIKQLRESKGIQQKQLALAIGVYQSAVSKWESGLTEPNPTQRKKLTDYFGISEGELFGAQPIQEDLTIEKFNPEIQEALKNPLAVKALLATHKIDKKSTKAMEKALEILAGMSPDRLEAFLKLIH